MANGRPLVSSTFSLSSRVTATFRLGNLRPDDAPRVLDVIMGEPLSKDLARTPLVHTHWRGRMGLTKDEQLQQYLLNRDSY